MPDFDAALQFVLAREGGYVNDPDDPGGATNLGITQRVFDLWRDKHSNPRTSVRHITHMEAAGIYRKEYWEPVRGDELPAPIALSLFDFAVNAGVGRAVETLQEVLKVAADGKFGPVTLAAVKAHDPKSLALSLCEARMAFYRGVIRRRPASKKYLHGWINRVNALRAEIEKL
jgi:lysozyme family protein